MYENVSPIPNKFVDKTPHSYLLVMVLHESLRSHRTDVYVGEISWFTWNKLVDTWNKLVERSSDGPFTWNKLVQ